MDRFAVKYTNARGERIMRGPYEHREDALDDARAIAEEGVGTRVVAVLWPEAPSGVTIKAR
ncbi:MAG TPA: hypothetical protein VLE97_00080 [Gaiellaceae bacterium]|nr:hypothetical protein [Gaiellaceae bacterium]